MTHAEALMLAAAILANTLHYPTTRYNRSHYRADLDYLAAVLLRTWNHDPVTTIARPID